MDIKFIALHHIQHLLYNIIQNVYHWIMNFYKRSVMPLVYKRVQKHISFVILDMIKIIMSFVLHRFTDSSTVGSQHNIFF